MRRLKAGGGKEAESLLIYSKDDLWYTQTPHIGGIENQLNGERTVSQIRRLRSSNRPRLKRVGEKRKKGGFLHHSKASVSLLVEIVRRRSYSQNV